MATSLVLLALLANASANVLPRLGTDGAVRVHVLTDELRDNEGTSYSDDLSPFWTAWRQGASAASAETTYKNYGVLGQAADADSFAAGISESCDAADALVVSIPFVQGTSGYEKLDDAINDCLDSKGDDFPIFSTAYDTYKNARLYGYVGSENFAVGQKCARALLFVEDETDPEGEAPAHLDAVSGRGPPLAAPVPNATTRCPDNTCQVYWPLLSRANSGMAGLVEGMTETLESYGFAVEVIAPPSVDDERAMINEKTGAFDFSRVLTGEVKVWEDFETTSNGFTVLVTAIGQEIFPVRNHLLCGTVIFGREAWMVGASPFRQGLTAVSSAAAAARVAAAGGEWSAARGNNEADIDSQSVVNPHKDSVGRTSRLQIRCSDDPEAEGCAGGDYVYDPSEASLGAILSMMAYGDVRVLGGTILDAFDSDCWRDEWEAEWGRPVGELSQFYYDDDAGSVWDGGDILGFVVLLSGGSRGDTLLVNFRGTQGPGALRNWLTNANFFKKKVRCPEGAGADKCMVHRGYWDAVQGLAERGMLEEVKRKMLGRETPPKVIFAGHSLGGAMATLAAFDAVNNGIEVDALYTVGSPRVFGIDTRDVVEKWRPFPCWRSVYGKDPVPGQGPEALGFRHSCVEVHAEGDIQESPFAVNSWPGQIFGDGSGRDAALSFARAIFDVSIFHHGVPYLAMHESRALDAGSRCLPDLAAPDGGLKMPRPNPDASCAERCERKTGSAGHRYFGPGQPGWLDKIIFDVSGDTERECTGDGTGGDCDDKCGQGYCTYAETELEDYPEEPKDWEGPWDCTGLTGRICCCDGFQTSEDGVDEVIYGGLDAAAPRAGVLFSLLAATAAWLLF